MDFYNALIAERENATIEVKRLEGGRMQTTSGTGEARVESIELRNSEDEVVEYVNVGEPVCLQVRIRLHADLPDLVFGYVIKDRLGQPIFGTNTYHLKVAMVQLKRGEVVSLGFSSRPTSAWARIPCPQRYMWWTPTWLPITSGAIGR